MMKTYKILLSFFLIMISGLGFSQSQSVPSYVPTNGLVGWWGFNGNAQDGSGNGNHGTVNGATLTTDRFGNQNGAYDFDGLNDFILANGGLNYATSIQTLSLWVNYSNTNLFTGTLITLGSPTNCLWGAYYNYLQPGIGRGTGLGCNGSFNGVNSTFNNSTWYNILIITNNDTNRVYLNGNYIGLTNNSYGNGCSISNLYFGVDIFSIAEYFNGKLDDIGIWNRALTQQEITNLYNSQSGITIPNLTSCLGDTSSVTISHPTLTGVANASLRMTYNPDSLTYVGVNSLNPAFNGMTISGGNGSVLMDWNTSTNQTIAAGNMVNLRFRVNGNSSLSWDTTQFPCEFSDVNFNAIPQTYVSGSINQNTKRFTWNRNICQGQSFALGNQSYTTSGTYQGRRFGTGGACDTLITLNLNVISTQTILPAVTTCSNQPYSFNGLSLTSSGTYLDTLINSLGCDSILQLNLTVNPAYNQNQSVVICTGTTYSFGGQSLSSSGTYSHTYTTANGCDSLVQLNLSVADSVSIRSANGSNGFCPGGSLRIGLVNPIPNVSYQWTKDGSIMTGTNTDSLMVTQSGVYQLTVQVSPTCSVTSNALSISVLNCNRITGDLKYDNTNQTPLAGVSVHLKTLLGNIVASDTTDATGGYEMSGYNNGNYVLDANVNYVPGGINSTDALQVTRFFTSLITLSPLRVKAGDVNGNNITNSADALLINRRITGLLSAFSVGGFVNSLPAVNAAGNPLQGNLRVLSTGDVNGTYNPLPVVPVLVLDTVFGNGNVGTAVVRFITAGSGVFERGIVWSSSPNPTLTSNKSIAGTGGFGFTHSFSSIDPNNVQYARAYARTSAGVYYSPERSFIPIPGLRCPGTPTVTDIDGNTYYTVQIGNQCWTQSNLRTSRYRNGDSLTYYPSSGASTISQWGSTTNGIFTNSWNPQYGHLYNGYGAIDSRGLCPTGWVIGNDSDWNILVQSLDSNFIPNASIQSNIAGSKIKSVNGWNSPNIATNESGFSAFPAHYRYISGSYHGANGSMSGFWTSSIGNHAALRYIRSIGNDNGNVNREGQNLGFGFSVRCLQKQLPVVISDSVNQIKSTSAQINGRITNDWGDIYTLRGFCYSDTTNPTINNDTVSSGRGIGTYSATISGLNPLTTYYVRSFARNDLGISYGSEVSFRTSQLAVGDFYGGGYVVNIDTLTRTGLVCAPTDTGWHVWGCMGTNIIGTSSALGSGQNNTNLILAGCGARPIAASVCADLVLNGYDDWFLPSSQELLLAYTRLRPMNIGNLGPGNYTSTQINSDLVNDVNTSGGFIGIIGQAFKWQNSGVRPFRYFTLPSLLQCGSSTVTDIDGNVYNTVLIGNQCWTQSNLKTSKYRNGDTIPTGLSNSAWQYTTSGAYAIYNNDSVNDGLYGKLYNHYAATDSRGLCPTGWHVPSDGEWTTLENQLGGSSVTGGALKSTALQPTPGGWNLPNTGATNSSGFTALPGGRRAFNGGIDGMFSNGYWWSTLVNSGSSAQYRYLSYNSSNVFSYNFDRASGFSVRCLKNTLPQVNTTSVTNVTSSTALVTGEVISEGGDQNTTRGFCYSTASNPTLSNYTTMNGTGIGIYSGTLMNLIPSTTYYIRAYATNSLGTSYGSELNFTSSSITIGSNYAGGIVFYLDSTGQHGLVCAPNDQGVAEWGCYLGSVGTSTVLGTGNTNTLAILNSCTQRPIAASLCADLILNGYDDWYLPSRDDLNLICQRIGSSGNFAGSRYWSSSQALTAWAQTDAWYVDIYLCQVAFVGKDNPYRVRAIRSF